MEDSLIVKTLRFVAVFIGGEPLNIGKGDFWITSSLISHYDSELDEQNYILPSDLSFHCNWEWLMPVVEKIEKLGFRVDIFALHPLRQRCLIYDKNGKDIVGCSGDNKRETVYRAVVQFIEYYNKESQRRAVLKYLSARSGNTVTTLFRPLSI